MVRYCCELAARSFGGSDGTFNAAGFSNAVAQVSGTRSVLDGHVVRALLVRPDIEPLNGGGHYRLLWVRDA